MKRRCSRWMAVLLSAAMMTAMTSVLPVAANTADQKVPAKGTEVMPFKDVKGDMDDEVYASIAYAFDRNLMYGVSEDEFDPDETLTRAMYVTVLGRVAEVDEDELSSYTGTSFVDEEDGTWYTPYVEWAYKNKITYGIGHDKFGPNLEVTREQIATLITRYLESEGITLADAENTSGSFKDESKISDWASDGVDAMVKAGILRGGTDGNFRPQDGTTRAEVAIIFTRLDKAINGAVDSNLVTEEEFADEVGEEVLYYCVDDYDADGLDEAFAITGYGENDEVKLYFINSESCYWLLEESTGLLPDEGDECADESEKWNPVIDVDANGHKIFAFECDGSSGAAVYGVEEGICYELNISGSYTGIQQISDGDSLLVAGYDLDSEEFVYFVYEDGQLVSVDESSNEETTPDSEYSDSELCDMLEQYLTNQGFHVSSVLVDSVSGNLVTMSAYTFGANTYPRIGVYQIDRTTATGYMCDLQDESPSGPMIDLK